MTPYNTESSYVHWTIIVTSCGKYPEGRQSVPCEICSSPPKLFEHIQLSQGSNLRYLQEPSNSDLLVQIHALQNITSHTLPHPGGCKTSQELPSFHLWSSWLGRSLWNPFQACAKLKPASLHHYRCGPEGFHLLANARSRGCQWPGQSCQWLWENQIHYNGKSKITAEINKIFFLLKKKREFEKSINTALIDQIVLLLFTFKLKN